MFVSTHTHEDRVEVKADGAFPIYISVNRDTGKAFLHVKGLAHPILLESHFSLPILVEIAQSALNTQTTIDRQLLERDERIREIASKLLTLTPSERESAIGMMHEYAKNIPTPPDTSDT